VSIDVVQKKTSRFSIGESIIHSTEATSTSSIEMKNIGRHIQTRAIQIREKLNQKTGRE